VDDDTHVLRAFEALLLPEGYDVILAMNGPEALAQVEATNPDVILLDIMMPGMDGFEVCQHLKQDKRWQHIPILVVTALESKADLVRGLDVGADDFLHKPVDRFELRARERSMLRIKRQFDELEAALRLREDLAHMIVHDMRTPLAAILGLSHLFEANASTPEVAEDAVKLEAQARRLDLFMTDLLMLAKMEQEALILNRALLELNPLISEVVEVYQSIAHSKQIQIVAELPEQSQQVWLDANLFQRVLENLLSNAFKYSPVASTITVRAAYPQQPVREGVSGLNLRLQVLDEGAGVPPEYRERIFEKYEIATLKKSGVPQVGLGLAFCKMVVEAHGGRIYVDDNQPQGSIFTVEL
jgi:signal transduction histidine kinase